MAEGDMDFSNMDGMDDIDWSDVEAELQQNRDMIQAAAGKKTGGAEAFGELKVEESGGGGEIAGASEVGVDFLLQIPLQLRVEVGTATMLIRARVNWVCRLRSIFPTARMWPKHSCRC